MEGVRKVKNVRIRNIPDGGEERMPNNCAIIGDIKKSRALDNWRNVFRELEKTLKEINRRYSHVIVLTFKPTVGDEFQGAIITPEKSFEIYNVIRDELQVDIYCGIGVGDIEKPLKKKDVGMRGGAFYRARDALGLCKKENRNIFFKSSDTPNLKDDTINAFFRLIEALESSWTKRQREVVNYYRVHPDYTYDQLSNHFGFSKQAASQFLKATNWEVISEGDNFVKKLLKNMSSS